MSAQKILWCVCASNDGPRGGARPSGKGASLSVGTFSSHSVVMGGKLCADGGLC